jgi:aminopeptidase N
MDSDSTDETRRLSISVDTPDDIDATYNPTITYGKGASIVRMVDYILSDETFRRGLTVNSIIISRPNTRHVNC